MDALRVGCKSVPLASRPEWLAPVLTLTRIVEALRPDGQVVYRSSWATISRRRAEPGDRRASSPVSGDHNSRSTCSTSDCGRHSPHVLGSTVRCSQFGYDRYALFQHSSWDVGSSPVGIPCVLETNAVISQEAEVQRDAIVLRRLAARLERRAYRRPT